MVSHTCAANRLAEMKEMLLRLFRIYRTTYRTGTDQVTRPKTHTQ